MKDYNKFLSNEDKRINFIFDKTLKFSLWLKNIDKDYIKKCFDCNYYDFDLEMSNDLFISIINKLNTKDKLSNLSLKLDNKQKQNEFKKLKWIYIHNLTIGDIYSIYDFWKDIKEYNIWYLNITLDNNQIVESIKNYNLDKLWIEMSIYNDYNWEIALQF